MADEPVFAQEEYKLAYLFISHDLGVVKHICENLALMHNAKFVEISIRHETYNNPRHIYTRMQIALSPDKRKENRTKRRALKEKWFLKYHAAGIKVIRD